MRNGVEEEEEHRDEGIPVWAGIGAGEVAAAISEAGHEFLQEVQ